VAFALDYLAIGLSALAGVSERRIERMVNPALSEGLPPFLAARPGLDSGLMIAQITAAALVSENKVLSHPASVDSITTSGNKEDYVSMGMAGALKIRQVVENTRHVLAIEAICAAQALDGNPHRTSPLGERARKIIRENVAHLGADRPLAPDIAAAASLIAAGALARLLLLTE
jgi:histidine ammonia-lyase